MNIRCASCSAEIPVERDEEFLVCPFCHSSLYLDRAHAFKSWTLKPAVSATGAVDRLAQELARREIPPVRATGTQALLAPFWGIRGEAMQETVPAFSPVPALLQGYRLPSADALGFDESQTGAFSVVRCSEISSSRWEGREDISSFTLYRVPFYRVSFGAGAAPYTAWVDAVTGKVYMDQAPPPLSEAISSRFLSVLFGLFALFTAVAAFVPGFGWSLLAVGAAAALSYPLVKRAAAGAAP